MQYSILSQMNPFVKRKKEKFEKNFAPKHQPKGLAARDGTKPNKNSFSCFLRRHSKTTLKPKAWCRLGHPERSRRGIMLYLRLQWEKPAESKFCFLKLPVVFGYVVPFAAISKSKTARGLLEVWSTPWKVNLHPLWQNSSFISKKVHQTLSRSRLRRFCSERCIAADAYQNANCFYAAVCTLLSPQNFDVRGDGCIAQP